MESYIYENKYQGNGKRVFDLFVGVLGCVVSLPVIFLVGIMIKLESPGGVFFIQERVGYKGQIFQMIKLRSMKTSAEENGPQWAIENDPRVTKIGKWMRKMRIDELPQFIHVLRGEMSVVGPRPERQIFTEEFEKDIPGFKRRLSVKPGITGWAQVTGGYKMTPREKWEADMHYIQYQSLSLDVLIILKTLPVVLKSKGAH